jgi:hypothetical protein
LKNLKNTKRPQFSTGTPVRLPKQFPTPIKQYYRKTKQYHGDGGIDNSTCDRLQQLRVELRDAAAAPGRRPAAAARGTSPSMNRRTAGQ